VPSSRQRPRSNPPGATRPGRKYNGGGQVLLVYDGDTRSRMNADFPSSDYDRVPPSPPTVNWSVAAKQRVGQGGRSAKGRALAPPDPTQPSRHHRDRRTRNSARVEDTGATVLCCPTARCAPDHQHGERIWRPTAFTVVMGVPRTSSQQAAVPRFLFSDFPLGKLGWQASPTHLARFTLELDAAPTGKQRGSNRPTVQSPLRWSGRMRPGRYDLQQCSNA